LDEYFKKKKVISRYIPFVSNTNSTPFTLKNRLNKRKDVTVFMYAGIPVRGRDLLIEMIRGFNLLTENEKSTILFIVVGVSGKEMIRMGLPISQYVDSCQYTVYLGRRPHNIVDDLYRYIDFSLLLKPEKKRFSKAGFPTKISESLAHGVPVVCNISSDLSKYLKDGVNSFIVPQSSIKSFAGTIHRALQEIDNYTKMRENARLTSQECLDIKVFSSEMEKLIIEPPIKQK
jgi:glycosyltransferase involved in cell wall biosynthesis